MPRKGGGLKVKVKQAGRVKPPKLDDPKLKKIGEVMVAMQLQRWHDSVNADGQKAKKLSKKYFFIKRRLQGGYGQPVRDMKMTGELIKNFSLRKATAGEVRAENTTRLNRDKASRCDKYEQMIGFAGTDATAVFKESLNQYGEYLKTAWVPVKK